MYDIEKRKKIKYECRFFYSDSFISSIIFSIIARRKIARVSFDYSSFAKYFLDKVSESNDSVYFIGSKQNEIEKTIGIFKSKYPNLKIAGYRHGYFKDENEVNTIVNNIIASKANFVICGLGTPFQEKFGTKLKNSYSSNIKIIYTCGGFLHQSSNKIQYYPHWINKFNLRWLYRLLKEKYTLKRILIQYPQFLFFSFYDHITNQFKNR
ncbi:WecB/TagA/CpsF family glycosyltransferase [Providencia manganoxydans]|uniref:WecB/TagA/CpsF family glycosyltransferase n=1 Tax=Providencia manganoxydans TaxID=2923283 RepID=UPI0034E4F144